MNPANQIASTDSTALASLPPRLDTAQALAAHLDALIVSQPHLSNARLRAGDVALRIFPAGFHGLARVVCGQQVSVASARAIWSRMEALGATTSAAYLAHTEETLRGAGLSRAKYATLLNLAQTEAAGAIDFAAIETMDADDAITALTALKGIGPWTAEIYLLFCTAHPDIFPAGDLALQKAVAHALELPERPDPKALKTLVADWAPHRGAAALLFWRYFSAMKSSGPNLGAWDTL